MGYVINFVDNQVVTAENLNNISRELGSDSANFEEGVVYGVDSLNQISESLITRGVSYGCLLSVSEGQILIGAGVLFMGDGKRIEIDAEGIMLPYEAGSKHYVWFNQDLLLGVISPQCTKTEPEGDDFVLLGEINESGIVSRGADRATMKNSYLSLNHIEEHVLTFKFNAGAEEEELIFEIQPERVGCRFAIISSENESERYRNNYFCGYVDLLTRKSFGIYQTTAESSSSAYDWAIKFSEESSGILQTGFCSLSGRYYINQLRFSLDSDNVLRIYRSSQRTGRVSASGLPSSQTITVRLC